MKKKLLLKIKNFVLNLRKVYNNQKDIIVDFLKSDLTDYLESDNCKKQM